MVRYVDKSGNILMESMLLRLFYQHIELIVASKISYNYLWTLNVAKLESFLVEVAGGLFLEMPMTLKWLTVRRQIIFGNYDY